MRKTITALLPALLAARMASADPALTIYNQDFAVVRDTIHLDLKEGVNTINYTGATAQLEPDSVVLRDPSGKRALQILEQNFRADPVREGLLLSYFEGKTIDFQREDAASGATKREIVRGKIVRSGYALGQALQPIIEVDGKLMFQLPGRPLFPSLPDDSILMPTLNWRLNADQGGAVDAELGYVTGGFSWHADYNLVAPEDTDALDLVGWVTMNNQSGKSFERAKIKLMAGDVNKIQPRMFSRSAVAEDMLQSAAAAVPPVTEKAFDDYHLYTLERPATLLDHETKQVEFVRAAGIPAKTVYVYSGGKVAVTREFYNSTTNHLGLPLPAGRMRFYRLDDDGQMEFTGEAEIDHTPQNEIIRVTTGKAFDLVGERKQTDYKEDTTDKVLDESFSIKLRNHKKKPVEIRIVEGLYRWNSWEITAKSDDFTKTDSRTIEFRVTVPPEGERTVTYTVHYSW